ncbi:MAG: histidine triad nucleotide-binding protein [Acidobacteriota bacterium]
MPDCLFCLILDGSVPSKKVYEDEDVYAFEDINPQAPVHVLVIPRKHIPTFNDMTQEDAPLAAKMFLAAQKIAREKGLDKTGYRLNGNCLESAGQSVFHIHFHLLGGRNFSWPPG